MNAMIRLACSPADTAESAFVGYIEQAGFPCLAAKTAVARDNVDFFHASSITDAGHDRALLEALSAFAQPSPQPTPFHSFVALFPDSPRLNPETFERSLWQRLQCLHDLDTAKSSWDHSVSSNPQSPDFSFSLAGHSFYVVGVHPQSERRARRFPITAMVFNLHRQFEQLRSEGRYTRFSEAINERDAAFHGCVNPMLDEHGHSSEARQYSGRMVGDDWECPFKP